MIQVLEVQEQDIFFSVIRAAIWERAVDADIPDGFAWGNVLQTLSEHCLLGLVARSVMTLPKEKRPQKVKVQDAITTTFLMYTNTRSRIQTTIVKAFDALAAEGITATLLKGESMVHYYPQETQRTIGDIDMLVPQEDYRRAVRILQHLTGDMGHEDPMERHYKLALDGFDIELHQRAIWCANAMHTRAFRRIAEEYVRPEMAETIILKERTIHVLPEHYNLLYIFNHFLEHLRDGGVGLKQLVDWTLLLHHASGTLSATDLRTLEDQLRRCGLFRAWKVMGGIAVMNLGLPPKEFPFYDARLAQKSQGDILDRILRGGDFGRNLHGDDTTTRWAPLRIIRNVGFLFQQFRFLWTLYPSGALASSAKLVTASLEGHAGMTKDNTVFE